MELLYANLSSYPPGYNGLFWDTNEHKPPKRRNMTFYMSQNLPDTQWLKIRKIFQKFRVGAIPNADYFNSVLDVQYRHKVKRQNYIKKSRSAVVGSQQQRQRQDTLDEEQNEQRVLERQQEVLQREKQILLDDLAYLKVFSDKNSNLKLDCVDRLQLYTKLEREITQRPFSVKQLRRAPELTSQQSWLSRGRDTMTPQHHVIRPENKMSLTHSTAFNNRSTIATALKSLDKSAVRTAYSPLHVKHTANKNNISVQSVPMVLESSDSSNQNFIIQKRLRYRAERRGAVDTEKVNNFNVKYQEFQIKQRQRERRIEICNKVFTQKLGIQKDDPRKRKAEVVTMQQLQNKTFS